MMKTTKSPAWQLRLGAGVLLVAATLPVQAQDAARALGGLFQSLGRPAAQPAQNAPAAMIGNLIGGAVAPQVASPQGGTDIMALLAQSTGEIDEPKEIEIGRQLAAVLLGSKPLYPDMALQRYVNQLGRWISLQSTRPHLPWTFAVLDDTGYNAFATPGGYIFVTKGLIDQVRDEAELAGILAHEITHVTGKHHLQAMRKTAQAGLLTQVVGSQLRNNLGGVVSAGLLNLGKDLYSKGLDQDDEFLADRTGVSLAASAGFDPYGLVAVLQQLRTVTPDNPAFTLTMSTHPAAQARLDQLELAMGNRLDSYAGGTVVTVPQRLAAAAQRENTRAATAAPAPAARPAPAPARKKL